MNTNLSFSVFTSNILSLLLIGTLFLSNRQRMSSDRDMKIISQMMLITAVSNIADSLVFYLDSSAGLVFKILVFASGSWLFLGNVLIGYTWAKFITSHLNITFSKVRKTAYRIGGLVAVVLLVINIFYPIVFSDMEGEYKRGPAYSVFLILAILYILDSMYLYVKRVKSVGTLKLFPVEVFLFPVAVGVIIQTIFVEIAITWTSIAIAIAGIMTALKNETIFLDHLTGLHNRVYLEFLQKQANKRKNSWVSGIMVDLNGFKEINDNYGHAEGDAALIITADVLRKSFSEYGVVTRYAGDEFVVMLNTTDESFVKELIERAKKNFEEASKTSGKPYRLSASMGYAISDLKVVTIDAFMNRIDRKMYEDKLEYYNENGQRKR